MKSKIGGKIFITAFTAILMMAALLMGKIPVQANPFVNGLTIFCEEETAEKLILEQNQKKILTVVGCSEDAEYQWQIRKKNTEDTWVDIFGKDDRTCEISYALLASMLDANGRAELRCTAVEDDAVYESAPVEIQVSWNVVEKRPASNTLEKNTASAAEKANIPVQASFYGLRSASARAAEYVSIQIDYEYQDGTKAFDPYVANLQTGTGFHATVPSPSIVGYEPWMGEDLKEEAWSVPIDYADGELQEDVRIKVVYKPAQVDYRVRYYLQNISDDLYTEDVSQSSTHKGETGSYPPNDIVKMQIDGFHALYYEPEPIAADGSTEFRCYYDREYYLMHFDLAGGYGVEPIYARFETPFVVNDPVRPGYVFAGWDLVETEKDGVVTELEDKKQDDLPNTIPSENRTYRAIWTTVDTTYTVVYWQENADDNGYSYWGYERLKARSASYVDGAAFVDSGTHDGDVSALTNGDEVDYFTFNEPRTDKHVLVEGDGSSVVNVYYTRNFYTITFKAPGKCTIEENHTHTDDCYEYICHLHTDACKRSLTCTIPEHKNHTDDCWICNKTEHVHSGKCCGMEEHSHSVECYGVDEEDKRNYRPNGAPDGTQVDGYIYKRQRYGYYQYYIYINGSWYDYTTDTDGSTATNGQIMALSCVAHTHDDTCCDVAVHTHTDACCELELHTHIDSCYSWECHYGEHTHTELCNEQLSCGIPEHDTHDDGCLICGKELHPHTTSCCLGTEHKHTKNCYSNVGNQQNNTQYFPQNVQDGYVYVANPNRYIYINGNWYRYTRNVNNGTIISATKCTGHVHGTDTCTYDHEEHLAHDESCYKDILHVHDSNCYSYGCGLNEHTHTNACYRLVCNTLENHVHSNTCKNQNSTNTVKTVTRKYGASLTDIWPIVDDNGTTYNSGERWSPSDSNVYSAVLVYISVMPPDDFVLTLNTANYDTFIMHYMVEELPGEDYESSYNGKNFTEAFTPVYANYNYVTKAEDFFDIKGFTQWTSNPTFGSNGQLDIDGGGDVYFYYERNQHTLQFQNVNTVVKTVESIPYEISLSEYKDYTPDYPSTLEPDAYYFDGWYSTAGFFEGTKVDFIKETMPDNDLMLYAKWEPKVHTVRFFNRHIDIEKETPLAGGTFRISHGQVLTGHGEIPTPSLPGYTFVGWFYMRDGEKQAFSPYDMTVVRDIDLFAEWSSSEIVNYTVHYVRQDTKEPVADTLAGKISAGQTKTFPAKSGADLYTLYQAGWFPTTNSHSILMQTEEENTFTFEYIQKENVPYKVRYVNKQTGEELKTTKVVDPNAKAVVTEKFAPVTEYIPDAYYKRLVLSANDDENVITFYYTPDTKHAYYVVHHMIEGLDGTYSDYAVIEGIADLNQDITAEPLEITGFTYDQTVTAAAQENIDNKVTVTSDGVSGNVTEDGLAMYIYYTRDQYPYTIKYLEYGTDKQLAEPITGSEDFGAVITASAKDISGYNLIGASPRNLEIRKVEGTDTNTLIFYYQQKQYTVRYVPVCTEDISDAADSCSVTISQELIYSADALLGSSPTMKEGFAFVGWYTDPECTTEVNAAWVDASNHLKPEELTGEDVTVYYALFQPLRSSLTIEKKGVQSGDQNQSFLFLVEGTSGLGKNVELVVSVKGNDSVTINELYVGEYKVTELADWSWRYGTTDAEKTADVQVETPKDASTKVTFTNTRNDKMWLGGETSENNVFDAVD